MKGPDDRYAILDRREALREPLPVLRPFMGARETLSLTCAIARQVKTRNTDARRLFGAATVRFLVCILEHTDGPTRTCYRPQRWLCEQAGIEERHARRGIAACEGWLLERLWYPRHDEAIRRGAPEWAEGCLFLRWRLIDGAAFDIARERREGPVLHESALPGSSSEPPYRGPPRGPPSVCASLKSGSSLLSKPSTSPTPPLGIGGTAHAVSASPTRVSRLASKPSPAATEQRRAERAVEGGGATIGPSLTPPSQRDLIGEAREISEWRALVFREKAATTELALRPVVDALRSGRVTRNQLLWFLCAMKLSDKNKDDRSRRTLQQLTSDRVMAWAAEFCEERGWMLDVNPRDPANTPPRVLPPGTAARARSLPAPESALSPRERAETRTLAAKTGIPLPPGLFGADDDDDIGK